MPDKTANAALAVGSVGAIAAAIALIKKGAAPAQAASHVGLDQVTTELLIALAQSVGNIETLLGSPDGNGAPGVSQGYAPNCEFITAMRVQITALNTGHQLPNITVPDDFNLLLRGWPTNGGIIYLAGSERECVNVNTAWPILPNDMVWYRVKNAEAVWVSGTAVGDFIVLTVERRSR